MADPSARFDKIRNGLTPRDWARLGTVTGVVVGLNILGWGMLAAAIGGHYHISKTEIFGAGTGILAYTLGMRRSMPITSPLSTTPPASWSTRANGR